jgi:hypothetical protein
MSGGSGDGSGGESGGESGGDSGAGGGAGHGTGGGAGGATGDEQTPAESLEAPELEGRWWRGFIDLNLRPHTNSQPTLNRQRDRRPKGGC